MSSTIATTAAAPTSAAGSSRSPQSASAVKPPRGGAFFVAAGIFLSRISGLVRDRVFAHYFGNSAAADAFRAAQRIPNFLQNLFGEGVLSASFIPVYAKLLGQKLDEDADRVAGAVGTLLALATSILALIGVLATPIMIDLIAPGFEGEKRELTIRLVRILFPGVALLVMSAWCLGILNSHRRFFLSYVAPVVWNAAIIATLIIFGGHRSEADLAITAAWGLVLGSFLQFIVQVPVVVRLLGTLRPGLGRGQARTHVRTVLTSFSAVVVARGVVQISAYIDTVLASLLPTGAVSALAYAQTLYLLPVSLFGMSVSAANLPDMSRAHGTDDEVHAKLREQLERGLRQIAFFIVPSTLALFFLGDVLVAGIYQTGKFRQDDVVYVWYVLAGYATGLLASTFGRLYVSTFYALQDPRRPLRLAILRVVFATALGYVVAVQGPRWLGIDASFGTIGLTVASALAGWIEFLLLRSSLNARIGRTGIPLGYMGRLVLGGAAAVLAGWGVKLALHTVVVMTLPPFVSAVAVFSAFGAIYFGATYALKVPQAASVLRRILRRQ